MTLDEAKAETLAWFDASRSPRVEWAGYVRREVIGEGLEDGRIYDVMTAFYRARPIDELSAVGIVVLASTFGLSMPLDAAHGGRYSPCSVEGCGGDDTARERVVVVFDALLGERFATMPYGTWLEQPDVASYEAAPAPLVEHVPRPTLAHPTATWPSSDRLSPTPTSVPTPVAVPLRADNVPAMMRQALSAYPLLPGSRWTWRATSCVEAVRWSVYELTEVVEEAWLLADDRVAVRSRRSTNRLSGVPWPSEASAKADITVETIWRTLLSDGKVLHGLQQGDVTGAHPFKECCMAKGFTLPLEPWVDPVRGLNSAGAHFTTAVQTSVSTLAGRFTDCGSIYVIGGNGHGTHRAICRGVGYVRSETVSSTNAGSGIEAMDLVDYDVVLPR